MPYTVYKTNGVKLTTVEDGKLNISTDLQLVGKNYAGYGQVVNENFIKLLENFSNGTAPLNPLTGQIWYDSLTKRLKLYTGTKWNQYLATTISSNRPVDLTNGEFWFDSAALKLYIKNRDSFVLIGPSAGTIGGASGGVGTSIIIADTTVEYEAIKLTIGEATPVVISPFTYNVDATDPFISQYTKIFNGITLAGADATTGISSTNGSYFWGTASDSLRLNGVLAEDYLLRDEADIFATAITELNNITRISTGGPSIPGSIEGSWTLESGSTLQSTFADLAERYAADAVYEPGTVLMIGGTHEVTLCTTKFSTAVAGVVSSNPAYMLNSAAGPNETHPYIALKGRIPCKVLGVIKKGDCLAASSTPGVAQSVGDIPYDPNCIIGKALEDYSSNEVGLIEIKV
jgi:hypothetical protein